jgi:hypothetical protein
MDIPIAVLQLVSYVMLTVASVTVGTLSAIIAYRNNFGWRPMGIVTTIGVAGVSSEPNVYYASVTFEVWNRRKYPIVVRSISINLSHLEFVGKIRIPASGDQDNWHRRGNKIYRIGSTVLSPDSHEQFTFEAPFAARPLDALMDDINLDVMYFDPRKKAHNHIRFKDQYQFQR